MDIQSLRYMLNWTPILMFHEILPDGTKPLPPYSMTQSAFRDLLSDFSRRGYTSGTLEDVESVLGGGRARKKRLVLTFDDGTRDFLEYAKPILDEFGFKATLFIVAGLIGGRRTWGSRGQPGLEAVPLMSAEELRRLHKQGHAIGSHTMSHPAMTALSAEEALHEVKRSREILSDMTGEPVRWFAYPYLAANEQSRDIVREAGYSGACGGVNQQHSRYYMNRLDASVFTLPELRMRTNGFYHMTRQTVRRVRYGT